MSSLVAAMEEQDDKEQTQGKGQEGITHDKGMKQVQQVKQVEEQEQREKEGANEFELEPGAKLNIDRGPNVRGQGVDRGHEASLIQEEEEEEEEGGDKSPALLFIVTTSPSRDWVICAPAAFLGCGSRFSGSLSGIEP